MQLIVLGSGSAFPSKNPSEVRNPAGCALRLDGAVVLFDCGFGSVRQLARAGLDPASVTDVFLTHRHPDHVGDLAALLFYLRYEAKPKRGRLRIWGPKGTARFVRELARAFRPWLSARGYDLEVRELRRGEKVRRRGWSLSALPVPHPTPALAYRLEARGKSVVYSGDTGYSAELADFAAECDLFVLECTLPSRQAADGHLNPPIALALLGASGCRRGLLTHLSDKSAAELRRLLPPGGRVQLASDLARLAV